MDIAESSVDDTSLEVEENTDSLEDDSKVNIELSDEISSADDVMATITDSNSDKVYGTVTIFLNDTQVAERWFGGGYSKVKMQANKISGSFEGAYGMKVVYHSITADKDYSNEGVVTFATHIENKLIPAEDFNFTLVNAEVDIKSENTPIMTFQWPNGTNVGDDIYLDINGLNTGRAFDKKENDASGIINLAGLYIWEPGTFDFTAYYRDEANYRTKLSNGTFRVTKAFNADDFIELYYKTVSGPTDYVCNVFDSYGNLNGEVKVLADGNTVYSQKFNGNIQSVRINANNLTGNLEGEQDIKVIYNRATNGKEYSKTATVTFPGSGPADTRPTITFDPDVDSVNYGNDVVVKIKALDAYKNVNKTVSANVLVKIKYFNGLQYVTADQSIVSVKNGVGSATFSNLDANDYSAFLEANDTDAYKANTYFADFTVNPAKVYVNGLEDIEMNYGDSVNITVSAEGASGIYAEIDGSPVAVDGFVIPISGLDLAEHTLEVTPNTDSNHEGVTKAVTINVKKADAFINTTDIIIYGSQARDVTIETEGASSISAKLGGDALPVNGNVVSIPALAQGTYNLTVTAVPDENHNGVTRNVKVIVKKYKSEVSLDSYELGFDYGYSDYVDVTYENATGFVAEIVDHSEANVNITGNTIVVSNLTPGKYVLKVTTVVDDSHEPATVTANVTVDKYDLVVFIPNNLEFDYGSSGGALIYNPDDVNLTGEIIGHSEAIIDLTNSWVTVSNLSAGKYELKVTPVVDPNLYKFESATANVTVNKIKTNISIMADIMCEYGSNASTAVESNVKFTAEVDGYPGAAVVNGNMVTVSGLNVGKYTLVVTTDDKNYETATDTANITVNKAKVDVSVGNIEYVYGTSGSANASPVDAKFTATVIDQPNAKVDVSGNKITVSNLAVGSYTLLVTLDDGNYDVANATANITVKPAATSIIADKVTITTYGTAAKVIITLKDANGNPISGKTVTVVIKGVKTVTAQTNKNGQIVVTTPKALEYGQYKLAISFKGDDNYTSSSKTVKGAVFKSVPKLTYSKKVVYKRNKQKKYTIILKSDLGYKIKKAKVYLTVNKKTYSGITNNKGKCIFKLNKLTKKGSYVAYIKYSGDKTHYKGLTQKAIITVK